MINSVYGKKMVNLRKRLVNNAKDYGNIQANQFCFTENI